MREVLSTHEQCGGVNTEALLSCLLSQGKGSTIQCIGLEIQEKEKEELLSHGVKLNYGTPCHRML